MGIDGRMWYIYVYDVWMLSFTVYIYLCYMHFEPPKYGKYQIFLKIFKGETSKKVESRQFVVTQLKSHSLNRKK